MPLTTGYANMTESETITKTILPKLADLGNTLRRIRQEIPMTQEQVAEWLQVGPKRIAEIESGKCFDLELICLYCEKVSVDVTLNYEVF